jgi:hypothetical protein
LGGILPQKQQLALFLNAAMQWGCTDSRMTGAVHLTGSIKGAGFRLDQLRC